MSNNNIIIQNTTNIFSLIQQVHSITKANFTHINNHTPGHYNPNQHIGCSYTSSIRDYVSNKKRHFIHTAAIIPPSVILGPVLEDESIKSELYIPIHSLGFTSSFRRIVLRSFFGGNDSVKKQMLVVEMYAEDGSFLASLNVTDVHGDFYEDDQIGGMAYSFDYKYLAYIAEQKEFIKCDNKPSDFLDSPDLGERYWGKRPPVLVVIEVNGLENKSPLFIGHARVVRISDPISPAQPFFALNQANQLVLGFVGYARWPQVLGIAHCRNRVSRIYTVPMPSTESISVTAWTPPTQTARNPVVNQDNPSEIVYLSCSVGGPHDQCARLLSLDFSSGKIMEQVGLTMNTHDLGLFADSLSMNCGYFIQSTLFSNVVHQTTEVPVCLLVSNHPDSATNQVGSSFGISPLELNPKSSQICSRHVMSVLPHECLILFTSSSLTNPPTLNLLNTLSRQVTPIFKPSLYPETSRLLESVDVHVYSISKRLEAMMVCPTVESSLPVPLVIVPHGGPHACFTNSWSDTRSAEAVALVAGAGYIVAYVNYTGSTGYGQSSVDALVGRIGDLEVEECHLVATTLLANPKYNLDPQNVFFIGGSHSGLIGTCLIGKYPGFYRAVSLRNPVTSVGAFGGSDIPDWAFGECGIDNQLDRPALITPEVYTQMWKHSCMSVIDKVVTPTLFLLGSKDARVPNYQAHEWCAWMRGHKPAVPVRTMIFKDTGHSLDSMDAQRFGFEATVSFFEEFRVPSML